MFPHRLIYRTLVVPFMDDAREKTLAVWRLTLAAPKLTDLPGDGMGLRLKEIVYAAILHAESILGMIDHPRSREAQHMNGRG